jgi:putative redox protein
MEAKVTWKQSLAFECVADSGRPILADSPSADSSQQLGPGPVEMVAMSLGACSAMDVISILKKKQQDVTAFEVKVYAERADAHPKVFTHATMQYQVTGHAVDEAAVLRAIELSVEKYCSVHAMLSQVFPIEVTYLVCEDEGEGSRRVVAEGNFLPPEAE